MSTTTTIKPQEAVGLYLVDLELITFAAPLLRAHPDPREWSEPASRRARG